MGDVERVDLMLQGDRADVGAEVEGAVGAAAQPVGQVLVVGHGGAQGDDPDRLVHLGRHATHPGAYELDDGPVRYNNEMDLVADEQLDVLHVLPLLPMP